MTTTCWIGLDVVTAVAVGAVRACAAVGATAARGVKDAVARTAMDSRRMRELLGTDPTPPTGLTRGRTPCASDQEGNTLLPVGDAGSYAGSRVGRGASAGADIFQRPVAGATVPPPTRLANRDGGLEEMSYPPSCSSTSGEPLPVHPSRASM